MNFGRWTVLARSVVGARRLLAAILLAWLAGIPAPASAAAAATMSRLSPQMLSVEITDVLTPARTNPFPAWVSDDGQSLKLPDATTFRVTINGSNVYLNDDFVGGQTAFLDLNKVIDPRRGIARHAVARSGCTATRASSRPRSWTASCTAS